MYFGKKLIVVFKMTFHFWKGNKLLGENDFEILSICLSWYRKINIDM